MENIVQALHFKTMIANTLGSTSYYDRLFLKWATQKHSGLTMSNLVMELVTFTKSKEANYFSRWPFPIIIIIGKRLVIEKDV